MSALPPRQLVTLPGRSVDLGLDAARVVQVALAREWMDVAPLDLAGRLGWEREAPEADGERQERVLVVRSLQGDVPVRASGKVGLRSTDAPNVLELPGEVLRGNAVTALSGVVIEEGKRPLLLLAPEGLWHLFQLSD